MNNAGIYRFAATFDTDDADFDAQFDTNLRAPYILVQQLVPGMVERGHGRWSTSAPSSPPRPRQVPAIYGASKAALELLTKVWADEFGAVRRARQRGRTRTDRDRRHRRLWRPTLIEGLGRTRRSGAPRQAGRDRQRGHVPGVPGGQLRQRRGTAPSAAAHWRCGRRRERQAARTASSAE